MTLSDDVALLKQRIESFVSVSTVETWVRNRDPLSPQDSHDLFSLYCLLNFLSSTSPTLSNSSGGVAVFYDIVAGAAGLQGFWDGPGRQIYPASGGAAIVIGTANGNATNLKFPTSATALYTETVIILPANVSTSLVTSNANRRYLRWMVVGLNPMTVKLGGGAAAVGQGMTYSGAAAVGEQGGSDSFDGAACPAGQINAISTLGTVVVVWEGV